MRPSNAPSASACSGDASATSTPGALSNISARHAPSGSSIVPAYRPSLREMAGATQGPRPASPVATSASASSSSRLRAVTVTSLSQYVRSAVAMRATLLEIRSNRSHAWIGPIRYAMETPAASASSIATLAVYRESLLRLLSRIEIGLRRTDDAPRSRRRTLRWRGRERRRSDLRRKPAAWLDVTIREPHPPRVDIIVLRPGHRAHVCAAVAELAEFAPRNGPRARGSRSAPSTPSRRRAPAEGGARGRPPCSLTGQRCRPRARRARA